MNYNYKNCQDEELFHLVKKIQLSVTNKKMIMNSGIGNFQKQELMREIKNHETNFSSVLQVLNDRALLKYF